MSFLTINENIDYIKHRILMIYNNNIRKQFKFIYYYKLKKIKINILHNNLNYNINLQLINILSKKETDNIIKKIVKKIDNIYSK